MSKIFNCVIKVIDFVLLIMCLIGMMLCSFIRKTLYGNEPWDKRGSEFEVRISWFEFILVYLDVTLTMCSMRLMDDIRTSNQYEDKINELKNMKNKLKELVAR